MPRETGNNLVEYALSEVDEKLRTVAVVFEDDFEILYLRDDLQETYSSSQYNRVVDSFRTERTPERDGKATAPLGAKQSLIHYHERAFVFQFPHADCHSILLSVEPSVGPRLESFITACQNRL